MLFKSLVFVLIIFEEFRMSKAMDNYIERLAESVRRTKEVHGDDPEGVIIVMGNESCDLDSAVSALVSFQALWLAGTFGAAN